jgi:cytochrome c-type biogenesis protein CcmH/NrfG
MLPAAILQPPQALDAKAFQARCAEFSKAKDWKGLEALCRAQVAADPKDAKACAALGYALFAQNRADEGRTACDMALKQNPKQVQALIYLGMEDARLGRKAELLSVGARLKASLTPSGVLVVIPMDTTEMTATPTR